jgi:poly-gamma-glutamate biosynthesis protein PgsC/CapC
VSELLPLSVGLGLAVSLLMTDVLGMATGGLIVPGYVALSLHRPGHLVATLAAALGVMAAMRLLGRVMILYGRRRAALSILLGYLTGAMVRSVGPQAALWLTPLAVGSNPAEYDVIGYVIPGLLAVCLERHGIVETLCAVWTAAVLVRLALVVLAGAPWLA